MRDVPVLIAIVDQVAGVATVTVCGDFGSSSCSRLRDRLMWVAAFCPRRLVLDLGASDQFTGQLSAAIVAAQRELPAGCLLEVRSASPAVRNLLGLG
jgi:hypothetical protein